MTVKLSMLFIVGRFHKRYFDAVAAAADDDEKGPTPKNSGTEGNLSEKPVSSAFDRGPTRKKTKVAEGKPAKP